MNSRWPRPLFYLALMLAIALDQLTKYGATATLVPFEPRTVIPGFFDLTYNTNTGVAFGMFAGQGLLVALFMIALGVLAFFLTRGLNWASWEPNVVGGCLCGGALGNLVDRLRIGHVVDFLDVYVGKHHWPTFNVADSFICVAVAWIVVRQLKA